LRHANHHKTDVIMTQSRGKCVDETARPTASRATVAPRSQGGTAATPPPYLPIAVRVPP